MIYLQSLIHLYINWHDFFFDPWVIYKRAFNLQTY